MIRLFTSLMRYMRKRGADIDATEMRLLWLVIGAVYVAVMLEVLVGVAALTLRRTWDQLMDNPTHFVPQHGPARGRRAHRPRAAAARRRCRIATWVGRLQRPARSLEIV